MGLSMPHAATHLIYYYINRADIQYLYILLGEYHSCYLHCLRLVEGLLWGAEPRFELGPAVQQADAQLSKPRRTLRLAPHPKSRAAPSSRTAPIKYPILRYEASAHPSVCFLFLLVVPFLYNWGNIHFDPACWENLLYQKRVKNLVRFTLYQGLLQLGKAQAVRGFLSPISFGRFFTWDFCLIFSQLHCAILWRYFIWILNNKLAFVVVGVESWTSESTMR